MDGIHESVPSKAEMINDCLGKVEGEMYRLLSAVLHGQSWAIHSLAYNLDREFKKATQEEKLGEIILVSSTVTKAYAKAVWAYGTFMGWDRVNLVGSLENLTEVLMGPLKCEVQQGVRGGEAANDCC